jgi:hypothetical protein
MTFRASLVATLITAGTRDDIPVLDLGNFCYSSMVLAGDRNEKVDTLVGLKNIVHFCPCLVALLSLQEIESVAKDIHATFRTAGGYDCSVLVRDEAWTSTSDNRENDDLILLSLEAIDGSD